MTVVANNLSVRNKVAAELSNTVVFTSGADHPRYFNRRNGKTGRVGFDDWNDHWFKPTGVESGTGGLLANPNYYSIFVVPVNTRSTYVSGFKQGNASAISIPIQASGATSSITWTIPVHEQEYIERAGDHTGADAAGVLTDADNEFGTTDSLVGLTIKNITQGTSAPISANTSTTITNSGAVTWDTDDEYQVVDTECNQRKIYSCVSTDPVLATAGPFYLIGTVEDNTTTTYVQTDWSSSTDVLTGGDWYDNLAPPSTASFCLEAFGRMWMGGGIRVNEGQAKLAVDTDLSENYSGNIDISLVTSESGGTDESIYRYTRTTGTWTEIQIGSYVTVTGGALDANNLLTDQRVLYVDSSGAYFDVANDAGVAEGPLACDITFDLNYIQGNTGANLTYFNDGFVGAKFTLDSDNVSLTVSWVDVDNQRLGLSAKYDGLFSGGTFRDYVLDGDSELYWSITNNPEVYPVANQIQVDDRIVGLATMGGWIIIFL